MLADLLFMCNRPVKLAIAPCFRCALSDGSVKYQSRTGQMLGYSKI